MPRNPSHELADAARRIADTYIGRSEQAWRVPAAAEFFDMAITPPKGATT